MAASKHEPKPSLREMELDDRLSDFMTGFEFWKEHKVAEMELTTLDEMFIRWMEHNA